jgi:protein involved in polysaccharide export with SLBB domain
MLARKKVGTVSVLIMLTIALTVFFGCAPVEIAPQGEEVKAPVTKDYHARVGDILQVKASPDPEKLITAENYEVAQDGSIKLIYIGPVFVEGKTKAEIESEIEELYSSYYKDMTITITILRFYFVSGEVRQPSRYALMRRTNLTEAIDAAGGFTDYAKESGVLITRVVDGKRVKKKYNCKKIRKGKIEDPVILPDDSIFIPRGGL